MLQIGMQAVAVQALPFTYLPSLSCYSIIWYYCLVTKKRQEKRLRSKAASHRRLGIWVPHPHRLQCNVVATPSPLPLHFPIESGRIRKIDFGKKWGDTIPSPPRVAFLGVPTCLGVVAKLLCNLVATRGAITASAQERYHGKRNIVYCFGI